MFMWKIWKKILWALLLLAVGAGVAFFVYKSEPRLNANFENEKSFIKQSPFRFGLDLSGGSYLTYSADVSQVPDGQVAESMDALRDVIERRINIFGVSEPIVQVQESGLISGGEERLLISLPGVTDVDKATAMIGQTPLLEFKVERSGDEPQAVTVDADGNATLDLSNQFVPTELTGRYLKRATLQFSPQTGEPQVSLQFDETGTKLFADITRANVGKMVAIYLDGSPISTPVVREEIPTGEAFISGSFNPNEAKQLVGRLNSGALPVPITLISKQTIGATLGESAISAGVKAGIVSFLLISLFLVLWYRLPGVLSVIGLGSFMVIMLALFKLIPVTLTVAGIAGFIIAIGFAVDANVLIFERVREELKSGRTINNAVQTGFSRAWFSIRDSNSSTFITAIILFWFGTPLIKGFALTLGLGVLVSLISALIITRALLTAFTFIKDNKFTRFLFSSGVSL
ncbi:MAG: protein translocase subunit SecD [Candidatus Paceibacterota bacterium]